MDWWLRLPSLGSYDIGKACINHGSRYQRMCVERYTSRKIERRGKRYISPSLEHRLYVGVITAMLLG
jgi:hypothetical protein